MKVHGENRVKVQTISEWFRKNYYDYRLGPERSRVCSAPYRYALALLGLNIDQTRPIKQPETGLHIRAILCEVITAALINDTLSDRCRAVISSEELDYKGIDVLLMSPNDILLGGLDVKSSHSSALKGSSGSGNNGEYERVIFWVNPRTVGVQQIIESLQNGEAPDTTNIIQQRILQRRPPIEYAMFSNPRRIADAYTITDGTLDDRRAFYDLVAEFDRRLIARGLGPVRQ